MSWFFIAITAPFLWATSNIIDKYLVKKYSKGEYGSGGLVLFSSLIGIFVSIGILIFTKGVLNIPLNDKLLLLLIGGLSIFWIILYLFALEFEDVSVVASWFLTIPIFGYILGYIFLKETLTLHQVACSIIILIGVFIVSIDFTKEKKSIKIKPALYMLFTSMIISIIGIIFKYITIEGNFWASSFWEYVGLGLSGLFIFIFIPKFRKEFLIMNKMGGKNIFILNSANELISVIGNLLTNFTFLLVPITMVYLVGSFQPAIALFLTILVSRFFPKIISENIETKILIPKIIGIFIIIAGSVILFV